MQSENQNLLFDSFDSKETNFGHFLLLRSQNDVSTEVALCLLQKQFQKISFEVSCFFKIHHI